MYEAQHPAWEYCFQKSCVWNTTPYRGIWSSETNRIFPHHHTTRPSVRRPRVPNFFDFMILVALHYRQFLQGSGCSQWIHTSYPKIDRFNTEVYSSNNKVRTWNTDDLTSYRLRSSLHCACRNVHTYLYTCLCSYICVHTYKYMYICAYIYIHVDIYGCMCRYVSCTHIHIASFATKGLYEPSHHRSDAPHTTGHRNTLKQSKQRDAQRLNSAFSEQRILYCSLFIFSIYQYIYLEIFCSVFSYQRW